MQKLFKLLLIAIFPLSSYVFAEYRELPTTIVTKAPSNKKILPEKVYNKLFGPKTHIMEGQYGLLKDFFAELTFYDGQPKIEDKYIYVNIPDLETIKWSLCADYGYDNYVDSGNVHFAGFKTPFERSPVTEGFKSARNTLVNQRGRIIVVYIDRSTNLIDIKWVNYAEFTDNGFALNAMGVLNAIRCEIYPDRSGSGPALASVNDRLEGPSFVDIDRARQSVKAQWQQTSSGTGHGKGSRAVAPPRPEVITEASNIVAQPVVRRQAIAVPTAQQGGFTKPRDQVPVREDVYLPNDDLAPVIFDEGVANDDSKGVSPGAFLNM